MEENLNDSNVRKANLGEALICFLALMAVMAVAIIKYDASPHMPMLVGVLIVSLMAMKIGYGWNQIEGAMISGITKALQSVIILAIIGVLIGVWMVSGVVPSMIYYGLKIISPCIFLPAALIICSITSLATGTSWGTAGTMGVALMGISHGLGIPLPITAGAVVSGAYFGDKMSPLSDTTNLAPAMAGTNVFSHVKFMMKPTIVTYIISLVFYAVIGMRYAGEGADLSGVVQLQEGIMSQFKLSPLLMIPPVVVIAAVALKVPAIPGISLGIIVAALMGPFFQGEACNLGHILSAGMSGYVSETGVTVIDELLTKGGLDSMMFSISLTIIAMMFGGIAEEAGILEAIVNVFLRRVKRDAALVALTEATCVISNATMPEQYISIVVPGRMFAPAYRERNLHPKTLSNALESAGTVSGALIPWNTCGVFISGILGVSVAQYGIYAIFNYLMPIATIVMAYMGITLAYMTPEERKILEETGNVA